TLASFFTTRLPTFEFGLSWRDHGLAATGSAGDCRGHCRPFYLAEIASPSRLFRTGQPLRMRWRETARAARNHDFSGAARGTVADHNQTAVNRSLAKRPKLIYFSSI